MRKLHQLDLFRVVSRLPKAVKKALKEHTCFLAGGFVRDIILRDDPSDIDLFVPGQALAATLEYQLTVDGVSNPSVISSKKTPNAYTIRYSSGLPVQVIHRWTFENCLQCISSFDFSMAAAGVWWDSTINQWLSACVDSYYEDLAARRLVYTFPVREEEAGGSVLRLLKFYQRGWRAPFSTVGGVMARMAMKVRDEEVSVWNNPAEREQKLAGVFSGLLVDVDPLVDPDHIMHESEANATAGG